LYSSVFLRIIVFNNKLFLNYKCQAFLKTRLEALDLLTPELKEFIMQDIDKLIPGKEIYNAGYR
jgi:hypothetical protein